MTAGEAPLSNVGPGPDRFSLAGLDAEFAVLVLHRDFYCSDDRQQVRRLKRRHEEFETRDVAVVSVLPEDPERTERWQKQYHLPFSVVADPEATLGDRFDQETRFGLLGKLHDVVGRMPATVVLDLRGDEPTEVFGHRGAARTDRPRIDDVLEAIDRAAAEAPETADAPEIAEGDDSAADELLDADDAGASVDDAPLELPADVAVPDGVSVRRAVDDDATDVLSVLQGALLDIDSDRVREAVGAGESLVAVDDGFVVGALVRDGNHVEAVAVRRERRANGVGRLLVLAAASDVSGALTADFRAGVRGFWTSLGFELEQRDDRFWGRRPPAPE